MNILSQTDFEHRFHFPNSEPLGTGSFGAVYVAFDQTANRKVALKKGDMRVREGYDSRTYLQVEVEVAAGTQPHGNVARYQEYFRVGHPPNHSEYAVMQYYPKGNLRAAMGRKFDSPDAEALAATKERIASGILLGLASIHQQQIIHRDLKPSNILLTETHDGLLKPLLADFGLGKQVQQTKKATSIKNSRLAGTPEYAAPEQLKSEKIYYSTDLWAAATMIFEVFADRHPYLSKTELTRESFGEVSAIKLAQEYRANVNQWVMAGVPQKWAQALVPCMNYDAKARPASAEVLVNELGLHVSKTSNPPQDPGDGTKVDGPLFPEPGKPSTPAWYSRPIVWLGAGVATIVLLILWQTILSQPNPPAPQPDPVVVVADSSEKIAPSPVPAPVDDGVEELLESWVEAINDGNMTARIGSGDLPEVLAKAAFTYEGEFFSTPRKLAGLLVIREQQVKLGSVERDREGRVTQVILAPK